VKSENPELGDCGTDQGDTGENVQSQTRDNGFHLRVTLGDLITIAILGLGLIIGYQRANVKIENTTLAITRLEVAQDRTSAKLDNWYERLIILEQKARDRPSRENR
jgi:hypothetical protein